MFIYTLPFTWNGLSFSFIALKSACLSLLAPVSITHELLLDALSLISSLFLNYYRTNICAHRGIEVR